MAPTKGEASDALRQSSTRRSLALSIGSAREDEDYDLSAIVVADGFRSIESSSSHTSNSQPATDTFTRTTTNTDTNTESDTSPTVSQLPPSPAEIPSKHNPDLADRTSSVSKPHRAHDSLTLHNDGSSHAAPTQPNAGATFSRPNASPSMRVESPYHGPSNPSHPYQMYPQRTLSNATSSTTDPSHNGGEGPAHPYSLYPQNTAPVEESEPHISVGFNSIGNTYQRQLGPDGEEAGDLIGPMGHLGDLPPYTRYPTEGLVRKDCPDAYIAQDSAGTSAQAIAGAGGIGTATRNPEFSTDEDLALSRSRPSVRSATSERSQHDINTTAREVTEKPAMGNWQRRAKKKMWGIVPYWAICLLVVGLVIMGMVMGAVMGTLLSRHKPPRDK